MNRRCCTTILLFLIAAGLPAFGQAEDPLAPLRGKTAFTDEDRGKISEWVRQRLTQAITGSQAAVAALRDEYQTQNATPSYKEAYASIYATTLPQALAQQASPAVAAQLVTVLAQFKSLDAQPVFVQLLKDTRVGVRAAAAIGLRDLRPNILRAEKPTLSQTLNALRDAGKSETAVYVLESIYSAMNYAALSNRPQNAGLDEVVSAFLELLSSRAALYEQQSVPAEGAELIAVRVGSGLRPLMNEAQQKTYLASLMQIIRHAVQRYTAELMDLPKHASEVQKERQRRLELLISEGEAEVQALLDAQNPPSMARAMFKQHDATQLKIAFDEWAKLVKPRLNQDFTLPRAEADANAGGPG